MAAKKLIVANWKMNKTAKEAASFITDFKKLVFNENPNEIVICPAFICLNESKKLLKGAKISLGAQNMHFEEKGAFTGEISASMIKDAGCKYVILGHSERRNYFSESNELINKKVKTALKNGLKVILCIGESLRQRENSETMNIIQNQIDNCLKTVGGEGIRNVIIAYEPVWAIGTGKNATPEQAEEAHQHIRKILAELYNAIVSKDTRIIYGGSVNADNSKELFSMENIDGALIGGDSFVV